MQAFIESLSTPNVIAMSRHPLALAAVAVLILLSILFRWKAVLLLLFAAGASIGVARYFSMNATEGPLGNDLVVLGGGTAAIALVLIYFLFIKGD